MTFPRFAVGDRFVAEVVTDLTRTQIVQYAGASGDFNPLHSDERFATEVAGFPTVFAHGMLTMALTGRVVTDTFGIANLTSFGGRFRAQVWPGDTLTSTMTVLSVEPEGEAAVVTATVSTVNQDGTEVFTATATATARA
ncbi:MaoC family dehydratase N-terminal domain-containing protein [Actinomadura madurae]|uniref:MaoC family dehydratase n=1 Tax=Actinomadura madurae TaxID=1993 RepID=UPI0039995F72